MIAKKRKFVGHKILILTTIFIVIILGTVTDIFWQKESRIIGKIYPNVYIDGQNFGLKSRSQVVRYFQKKSQALANVNFTVIYKQSPIATFSAKILNLQYDASTIADRAYLVGRSSNLRSRYYQKFLSLFNLRKFYFDSQIEYDDSSLKDFLLTAEDTYNVPAQDALFNFQNNKVTDFKKDSNGVSINSDQLLVDFASQVDSLKKNQSNKNVVLNYQVIQPNIKLADINNFGIEEFIAEGKSDYSHSISSRIHNVILAASKFNGVLIPKGDVFSFNDTIGDISSLTGYQPAYIIKDGRTVLGDGGGVCQVSTTLFRAALNAGLPIVERHAHDYRVGYYENDSQPGFDATVFAPSVDLKIKNDTPAYILIETFVDTEKNLLYFRFYGKKDNRQVKISNSTVYDVTPALPTVYQDDPTLRKGVVKQTDFSAAGAKVFFTYQVTNPGTAGINETFYSDYLPWAAVYAVGTGD